MDEINSQRLLLILETGIPVSAPPGVSIRFVGPHGALPGLDWLVTWCSIADTLHYIMPCALMLATQGLLC